MISVVMPAYNASEFIGQTIESILSQTFREFEFIIVDDGSTDSTLEIIQQYATQDDRIRVVKSDRMKQAGARNLGVQQAQYDWIAMMDADDIALPQRFEKQITAAKNSPHIPAWGSYTYDIGPTGKVLRLQKIGKVTEEDFYTARKNGEIPFVRQPSAFIKKSVFLELGGYDSQLPPTEDFDLFYRIGKIGPVLAIPEPLVLYRVHASNDSSTKFWKQFFLMRYIYAKNTAFLEGKQEPTLQEFTEWERQQPLTERLRRNADLLVRFWYRKTGLLLAKRPLLHPILDFFMTMSSNPLYTTEKDWKEKLPLDIRLVMERTGSL